MQKGEPVPFSVVADAARSAFDRALVERFPVVDEHEMARTSNQVTLSVEAAQADLSIISDAVREAARERDPHAAFAFEEDGTEVLAAGPWMNALLVALGAGVGYRFPDRLTDRERSRLVGPWEAVMGRVHRGDVRATPRGDEGG